MPLDLDRYLSRIGIKGPIRSDADGLHALTRAHTETIPFENLDVLHQRPISLDPEALFRKLVLEQRGGYCFEQNGLFLAVLRMAGLEAHPLGGRVRLRTPDRAEMPARTHLFIAVRIGGEMWLTDVGFGGLSLTRALRWEEGWEQETPHDRRRIMRDGRRWFHQVWRDDAWVDVYEFDGEPMFEADRRVAHWYTSAHPDSSFRKRLIVARALPDGGRIALLGNELRCRRPDGRLVTSVTAPENLREVLLERFGLSWPADGPDPEAAG